MVFQTDEQKEKQVDQLVADARKFGQGFLVMRSNGDMECIPPSRVVILNEKETK